MKTDNERDDIAEALAPYAPPQTMDESAPRYANGEQLDYRTMAELLRTIIYHRRIKAICIGCLPLCFITTICCMLVFSNFVIAGVLILDVVLALFFLDMSNSDKLAIERLKRVSMYRFSWFVFAPDPVSYAVKLLCEAGYRANRFLLPDMAQFDPPKEESHEE